MISAVSVEPVKHTPFTRGSEVSRAPTVAPSPGRSCSAAAGTPAFQQEARGQGRDQRGLFGGLGQNIAGRKRGRDLAGEDRQREVPGADAGEGSGGGRSDRLRARRVVAQEIDRLAQFGHRIGQRLARLARQKRKDGAEVLLVKVGGTVQDPCPFRHRRAPGAGSGKGGFDILARRVGDAPHPGAGGGVRHEARRQALDLAGDQRLAGEIGRGTVVARRVDARQRRRVRQVEPFGVSPFGREKGGPLADHPVRDIGQHRFDRRERIGGDGFRRDLQVDDLVHEGGVGAVFQQPPHQIGQKVAVRADGGVDSAARGFVPVDDVVQTFAHPVKALKLERRLVARHVEDRGDGMGVVGGELRIDPVRHPQKLARIRDVGHVGRFLAGKDREVVQPQNLRALHLCIPVGALDKADHDLAVKLHGQRVQPVDDMARAPPVALDDHAETVPAGKLGVRQDRLDHLQRQGQAVGLLCVDVETHPRLCRLPGQVADNGHKLGHDAGFLRNLVARVQCRQLDRDAGVDPDIVRPAGRGYGRDRARIGGGVAPRIAGGLRRLAQHVVGIGIALRLHPRRAVHRAGDRLAQNELLAHFLHRARHRRADHRFAKTADGVTQVADDARLLLLQDLAGQHQRPGRCVDQRRGGIAKVLAPVRRGDLVLDQRVHGFGVRHAQQCLGQAHQRDALFGGKTVFGQKDLHQAGPHIGADSTDKIGPTCDDPRTVAIRQRRVGNQPRQKRAFWLKRAGFDAGPERVHDVLLTIVP